MEPPEWLSASGLSYTRVVSRKVGPAVNALKGCVGLLDGSSLIGVTPASGVCERSFRPGS